MSSLQVSPRRIGAAAVSIAVAATASLLAPGPGSASAPVDCREVTCATSFTVGGRTVKWASPEVFYPNNERVFAHLATERGPLALIRSHGAERCKHRLFGNGISALVKACGSLSPLRVRAVRLKRGALSLSIVYSASAAMDGAPAPPVQGASLASPQLLPISRPLDE